MPSTPTDAELGALYAQYAPVVLRRARSILGNEEQAQDAVQETFAKVISAWDQFRGEASPTTWIYRITTNLCLNQLRNHKGRREALVRRRQELIPDGTALPDRVLDAESVRTLLQHCDDETRRIIVYVYFDDMTREQAAELVGRSVPTVRKRIRAFLLHARQHLTAITVAAAAVVVLSSGGF